MKRATNAHFSSDFRPRAKLISIADTDLPSYFRAMQKESLFS